MIVNFLTDLFIFVFGLCVGSFLNCLIYRLEEKKKITGRSFCPNCKKQLKWQDLIPVFSFLFLKGKCRYCQKSIFWQYPAVEILTATIFLLIFNHRTERFALVLGLSDYSQIIASVFNLAFLFYIASSLIVISVYDLKHYLIPDKVLFPAIAIAFVFRILDFGYSNLFRISNFEFRIFAPLLNYFWAAVIASGFFLMIFLVSKGRWMGFGDVKLAVLMGFLLGLPDIFVALFLAFFFGAIIGLMLMIFGKKGLKSEIPFGPFLIAGTFAALFCGEQIMQWYLNFFQI